MHKFANLSSNACVLVFSYSPSNNIIALYNLTMQAGVEVMLVDGI
jgi:hypothetical protein